MAPTKCGISHLDLLHYGVQKGVSRFKEKAERTLRGWKPLPQFFNHNNPYSWPYYKLCGSGILPRIVF
jgi:hypothetical protein